MGELALATFGFVFPSKVTGIIEKHLTDRLIERYREDPDLQNIIDFTQQEFQCCGLSQNSYKDWSKNEYFNCDESNPSVEKCGVPFSCCRNASDINTGLINIMCGYGAQGIVVSDSPRCPTRFLTLIITNSCSRIHWKSARRSGPTGACLQLKLGS